MRCCNNILEVHRPLRPQEASRLPHLETSPLLLLLEVMSRRLHQVISRRRHRPLPTKTGLDPTH